MAMEGSMPAWLQSLLILLSLGAVIYLTIKQARDVMKLAEETQERIYTEIRCGSDVIKREFREGDYVGAATDECEGGRIVGIYAVTPQGEERAKKRGFFSSSSLGLARRT